MDYSNIKDKNYNKVLALDTGDTITGMRGVQRYLPQVDEATMVDLPDVKVHTILNEKRNGKGAVLQGTIPAASVPLIHVARLLAQQAMTGVNLPDIGEAVEIPTWQSHVLPREKKGPSKDARNASQKAFATFVKNALEAAGKDIPASWNLRNPEFLDSSPELQKARERFFGSSDLF